VVGIGRVVAVSPLVGGEQGGTGGLDALTPHLTGVLVETPAVGFGFEEDQLCFHVSHYAQGV
jgi:hypothetical protein